MNERILVDPSVAFDEAAPGRVVSLVPSTTASLLDLGLGDALVGISDYCVYPKEQVSGLARVGGPKSIRVADIIALRPDLVIANREENDRQSIEALAEAGAMIWLTFPTSVQAAINDLWTLANLFRSNLAMQQVDFLERAVEWAGRAAAESADCQPAKRYFCPIWQDRLESGERWWMTFNAQTYASDVLRILGGENSFGSRERRYPLEADLGMSAAEEPGKRDLRYPHVGLPEIIAAAPDIILLPSEPYAYGERDGAELSAVFAQTPAAQAGRIYTIDGTLITWHGTRLARALEELPEILCR
jgi:ABC-type Fe3+-hydroxamate transport system substrate-binding protein